MAARFKLRKALRSSGFKAEPREDENAIL